MTLKTLNNLISQVETTCKGWKERGLEDNTEVEIELPDYHPFWVRCDVEILNGTGVTQICEYTLLLNFAAFDVFWDNNELSGHNRFSLLQISSCLGFSGYLIELGVLSHLVNIGLGIFHIWFPCVQYVCFHLENRS